MSATSDGRWDSRPARSAAPIGADETGPREPLASGWARLSRSRAPAALRDGFGLAWLIS
jgi:hypothetical protein